MQSLMSQQEAPELQLDFAFARDNFYAAARHGLDANINWLDGSRGSVQTLLADRLLLLARQGLETMEIDRTDIDRYLGIVEARIASGQTGTVWQRGWVASHGPDLAAMTDAYRQNLETGRPVHEWGI